MPSVTGAVHKAVEFVGKAVGLCCELLELGAYLYA